MPIISTALFSVDGAQTYFFPRREEQENITQIRKAASRHWAGRVKHQGGELERVYLLEITGLRAVVHERDAGRWLTYPPGPDPSQPILACIEEAGGLPAEDFTPPETLEINGYIYRLDL